MSALALQQACSPAITAQAIGRAATLALYDELALEPKPGLVTLTDTGSHSDMDAHTFMRSLFALRGYFVRIATLGAEHAAFPALERCGIDAEARMLAATGGINTHRGAIFMLGLLCAAAGAAASSELPITPSLLRSTLDAHWGADLRQRAKRPPRLPGGLAARQHGLRSASDEAADAFPVLFDVALPRLQLGIARALPRTNAHLDTLFSVMAVLDDSNLAHRGGMAGLMLARSLARDFIGAGGSARPGGLEEARRMGHEFVRRRLSPGGSADTLAAACWFRRMGWLTPAAARP
jgi:triphosphoribosyl-dephospho-CoA synthase